MTDNLTIQPGSTVKLHYSITLEDGTVADSTQEGEPLDFVMGDGTMIEGLEMALYGLKAGDNQTVSIDPLNAFGFSDDESVHTLPRSEFNADMSLKPGLIMSFSTPAGDEIPGVIKEVSADEVVVDFNHPLADHEITFSVEILSVQPAADRKDKLPRH